MKPETIRVQTRQHVGAPAEPTVSAGQQVQAGQIDVYKRQLMGCVEPQKAGRLYQWTSTSYTQWPICIELVLNHGVPLWYGKQVTPDLGDLDQYTKFEQFDAAVKEQIKYVTKWTAVATVISQRVHRDLAPKPLMSIMYEGCMEKGKDVSAGGAMYNFGPGVVWSGLATYADAMAAIKKLVFDDKKYTLKQLNEGLKADFEMCIRDSSIIPSVVFLAKKKKFISYMKVAVDMKKLREILAVSVSPFGLTFAGSVILIIVNRNAIKYGGDAAAACYAVISYVTYIVQMLIQGVGDGLQPLICLLYTSRCV